MDKMDKYELIAARARIAALEALLHRAHHRIHGNLHGEPFPGTLIDEIEAAIGLSVETEEKHGT